ncbi:MAG: Flp pilus assembly protein CpaB [Ilumatobacteraceae bacterium]
MKRKFGGIVVAIVLAVIGTVSLMGYVNKAKNDAVEDSQQIEILVVARAVPQGASIAVIAAAVEPTLVPQRLVSPDALRDLDGLDATLVAGVALQPGEQLLRSRLVGASTLVRVEVPAGLQEITIALAPERAVGGVIQPGETVGLVISFEPFGEAAAGESTTETTDNADGAQSTPNTSHLTLSRILVTAVQYSASDTTRDAPADGEDGDVTATTVAVAPSGVLLVTLAVTTAQAEQIVFGAEFGSLWLTRQNADTDTEGGRILTLDQVYVIVQEL